MFLPKNSFSRAPFYRMIAIRHSWFQAVSTIYLHLSYYPSFVSFHGASKVCLVSATLGELSTLGDSNVSMSF